MSGMTPQKEIRVASDGAIARDPRTSCYWQGYVGNEHKMSTDFGGAMFKLSLIGQQKYLGGMYDCSGALPKAVPRDFGKVIKYPGGYGIQDVERKCFLPFPKLGSDPGVAPVIPADAD